MKLLKNYDFELIETWLRCIFKSNYHSYPLVQEIENLYPTDGKRRKEVIQYIPQLSGYINRE